MWDALRATVSELDDEEADSVTKMSQHIESYNNITCYTKRGPAENSYVVYVCYDIKFQNVDTMAPSLNMLYVCTARTAAFISTMAHGMPIPRVPSANERGR